MSNYKTYQFTEALGLKFHTIDISGSLLSANVDSWACSGGLINEKH